MSKRHLHHILVGLRKLRYRYLILALVISLTISLVSLRQNNLNAIELRNKVLAADSASQDVEKPLRELREYVYGHMNTNLSSGTAIRPPIQLKARYERLLAAEKARVNAANDSLYTQAQTSCEQQVSSRRTIDRVPCVQEFLANNQTVRENKIPDALYKFDFVSPVWSFDLAGISLLTSAGLGVGLIARFMTEQWLKMSLRKRL